MNYDQDNNRTVINGKEKRRDEEEEMTARE